MRILATTLLVSLILAGCQSTPSKEKKKPAREPVSDTLAQSGEWQPSALTQETIIKINTLNLEYQRCLQTETAGRSESPTDPRALGDDILRQCEDKLTSIQSALDAEGAPPALSARYLRKNRSQGAQRVMRALQFAQAQRAAEQDEALRRQSAITNKNK